MLAKYSNKNIKMVEHYESTENYNLPTNNDIKVMAAMQFLNSQITHKRLSQLVSLQMSCTTQKKKVAPLAQWQLYNIAQHSVASSTSSCAISLGPTVCIFPQSCWELQSEFYSHSCLPSSWECSATYKDLSMTYNFQNQFFKS